MSVEVKHRNGSKVVTVGVGGKLTQSDYAHFVPEVEKMIRENGKIRMMVKMHDFHGWEASALWEDIRFDVRHFSDIERLAIVGETKWQKGMAAFCRPFTTAEIKYFDQSQLAEAQHWLSED